LFWDLKSPVLQRLEKDIIFELLSRLEVSSSEF
jgi:hypothetical protein